MTAILSLLAKPLLEAFLNAFGRALLDLFQGWRAEQLAREAGRASAVIAAHEQALTAEKRMSEVQVMDEDELLKRLRGGEA